LLKGINPIISPDLMKVLMEMGHGDEIVFGDRNFPGNANASVLIRYDGCSSIGLLLEAILPLFPLDYAAEFSCVLMQPAIKQKQAPSIWKEFVDLIKKHPDGEKKALILERPAFIERAKKAYCVIVTSEAAKCGNIILRKGVVPQ
jgi:L-fucose mutarotase